MRSAGNSVAPTPRIVSAIATPVLSGLVPRVQSVHEAEFSRVSMELNAILSAQKNLMRGKTIADVKREIDVLRGHKRALEFALPVLREEQSIVLAKLEKDMSELPSLQQEFHSLSSDQTALRRTVADVQSSIEALESRINTEYPDEAALTALSDRNDALRDQVESLEKTLEHEKSYLEDLKGAGGVEHARWDLRSRKKDLLEELRLLESRQRLVCESWITRLGYTIDREERRQRIDSLERDLSGLRENETKLFTIPEHVTELDYEGEDIEMRQRELASLHAKLREADLVHRALLDSLASLERDLK